MNAGERQQLEGHLDAIAIVYVAPLSKIENPGMPQVGSAVAITDRFSPTTSSVGER